MARERLSLKPGDWRRGIGRRRLGLRGELLLALLPTLLVLLVLALVENLSRQGLLYASLASSAFLIYLDPESGTNSVRTLTVAQLGGALLGWGAHALFGPGYLSAGSAVCIAILLMIVFEVVHPPAVGTAISFALLSDGLRDLLLFALAVAATAALAALARAVSVRLPRVSGASATPADPPAPRPPDRG
jgi:CBS-domain-containing membrane protein